MTTPIYTIGQGRRFQYAQAEDGFWWKRARVNGRWRAWTPTGTRNRPADIWYNPSAGKANLPTEGGSDEQ